MKSDTFRIALISDVFHDDSAAERLDARLAQAKSKGADLAVLPEIPLNQWSPATKDARDEDAEAPGGPRHQVQSAAAKAHDIALVGGAIVQDPETGVRRNTALVFDADGALIDTYCKLHVPHEPGFWERDHYDAGDRAPQAIDVGIPIGVQICSDINRPEGSHLLGALGAAAIVAPRSTELASYDRWRPVFRANAFTSRCYVLSVNRPGPEFDVLIGGHSIAVAPNGKVIAESSDPVVVVELERSVLEKAKTDYPGYLPVRADLYAKAWAEIAKGQASS